MKELITWIQNYSFTNYGVHSFVSYPGYVVYSIYGVCMHACTLMGWPYTGNQPVKLRTHMHVKLLTTVIKLLTIVTIRI